MNKIIKYLALPISLALAPAIAVSSAFASNGKDFGLGHEKSNYQTDKFEQGKNQHNLEQKSYWKHGKEGYSNEQFKHGFKDKHSHNKGHHEKFYHHGDGDGKHCHHYWVKKWLCKDHCHWHHGNYVCSHKKDCGWYPVKVYKCKYHH